MFIDSKFPQVPSLPSVRYTFVQVFQAIFYNFKIFLKNVRFCS
jgi:hypothetical protein